MFYKHIHRKHIITENFDNFQSNNYTNIIRQKQKYNPIEFSSGLIIDSDLLLIPATSNEKKLLNKVGLNTDNANAIYVIKTRNGKVKGAITFVCDKNKNIISINYIDADADDSNFKKGIIRLKTAPGQMSLQQDEISVTRNTIRPDLIDADGC